MVKNGETVHFILENLTKKQLIKPTREFAQCVVKFLFFTSPEGKMQLNSGPWLFDFQCCTMTLIFVDYLTISEQLPVAKNVGAYPHP